MCVVHTQSDDDDDDDDVSSQYGDNWKLHYSMYRVMRSKVAIRVSSSVKRFSCERSSYTCVYKSFYMLL